MERGTPSGSMIFPALVLSAAVCLLLGGCDGGGVAADQQDMLVTAAAKDLVAQPSDVAEGYRVDPENSGPLEENEVAEWHLGYDPLDSVGPDFIEGHAVALAGSDESAAGFFYSEALVFRTVDTAEALFQTAVRARSEDGNGYTERESPEADVGDESVGYDYRPTLWGDAMLPKGWAAYHVVWRYLNVHGTCTGMGKGADLPERTLRLAQAQVERMQDPANTTELDSQASDPPASYELRDLGTLGGELSMASDMNDRGQVVGWSSVEEGKGALDPSVFGHGDELAGFAATCGTGHAFLWEDGELTDLGTLGGTSSFAKLINDRGQVVGYSTTASGEEHAFLWEEGEMTDLGTLGGKESTPWGFNDRGDVVGSSTTKSGKEHAFLWRDGEMTDLGTLGRSTSSAYGINSAGQVIGGSAITGSYDMIDHPFLWENGKMIDLGTLYGDCSAYDINDRGQVIGVSVAKTGWHAFLWQDGSMTDLGTLGGKDSHTSALDDAGHIVGYSDTAADASHAFLWQRGKMIDLGTLGGNSSSGVAVNESGQIVGWSQPAGGPEWWQEKSAHAFLWEKGKMIDLGTLGGNSSSGVVVNERGQIAGNSATSTGESRAVLWTLKH